MSKAFSEIRHLGKCQGKSGNAKANLEMPGFSSIA